MRTSDPRALGDALGLSAACSLPLLARGLLLASGNRPTALSVRSARAPFTFVRRRRTGRGPRLLARGASFCRDAGRANKLLLKSASLFPRHQHR
jgi:hypothetical protein